MSWLIIPLLGRGKSGRCFWEVKSGAGMFIHVLGGSCVGRSKLFLRGKSGGGFKN